MNVCRNTGLTVPECSCRNCLRALLREHMPSLAEPPELGIAADGAPGLGLMDPSRAGPGDPARGARRPYAA